MTGDQSRQTVARMDSSTWSASKAKVRKARTSPQQLQTARAKSARGDSAGPKTPRETHKVRKTSDEDSHSVDFHRESHTERTKPASLARNEVSPSRTHSTRFPPSTSFSPSSSPETQHPRD